ncbi:hypothetical protein AL036_00300 [Salipiger aestuarii]|uniref:hypothetical protein n=1 Tax=Salipiger aestuarii TaxID=568098 RepID=UPI00025B65C6|nr:hypothetical protein [Salipiger aestuarii]EIE48885.1 hypothetical protein C357_22035 [Citreicella sp. 357]KAA8610361.1 hypothetical protein AL036_00300 [Salipiger aestuarii]KAA8616376.1 hypothetical protein AL037_00300 [Salipiger aestuarii]KAB2543529.1 hypothetical protein AL035_01690 [Salipiger aestuarii]
MIFAAGLLVAFVVLLFWNRKNRDRRLCRWREYRRRDASRWTCIQCGAVVEAPPGETPTTCLRPRS